MLILYIRKGGKSVTISLETKVLTVLVAKYWLQFNVNFHPKHHLICEFLRHAHASHRAETFLSCLELCPWHLQESLAQICAE